MYPTGRGIAIEPVNSPGAEALRFDPKRMLHSLRKETVQNGRTKSWLSICGGMQSAGSYIFTMQLSGTQVGGRTCHRTNLLIIVLKRSGIGSETMVCIMPGGFPFLSCHEDSVQIYRWGSTMLYVVQDDGILRGKYRSIIVTASKLDCYPAFTTHPFLRFSVCAIWHERKHNGIQTHKIES